MVMGWKWWCGVGRATTTDFREQWRRGRAEAIGDGMVQQAQAPAVLTNTHTHTNRHTLTEHVTHTHPHSDDRKHNY